MPTLYYAVGACSLAPHVALEWIGAPYEAVRVQFGSEELLAVNPAGAMPTLREDDGGLLGLEEYPNVQALHDRLAADPAVQKVLAREAGDEPRKASQQ